jgi:hypothetical protein
MFCQLIDGDAASSYCNTDCCRLVNVLSHIQGRGGTHKTKIQAPGSMICKIIASASEMSI